MLKQISPDFYQDTESGRFYIIAKPVKGKRAVRFVESLRDSGVEELIGDKDKIVQIDEGVVKQFKKIELEQRLSLNPLIYSPGVDYTIARDNGHYLIAAEPLPLKQTDPELRKRLKDGRLLVSFITFYRSGIAQNEINQHFSEWLLTTDYSKLLAKDFANLLLEDDEE